MRMSEDVWGRLPPDLLERVIAFLPLSALARFRVVSKRLNSWIVSTRFSELCAGLPLRRSRIFFCNNGNTGTLEVSAGEGLFPFDQEHLLPYSQRSWWLSIRAATGSLLYLEFGTPPNPRPVLFREEGPERCGVICDLAARTCTKLPPLGSRTVGSHDTRRVIIAVDETTHAVKVVNMDQVIIRGNWAQRSFSETWSVDVYDSSAANWQRIRNPYTLQRPSQTEKLEQCALLVDKVYILLRRSEAKVSFYLVAYDTNTGTYAEVAAEVPKCLLWPKLIAVCGRLLLVGGTVEKEEKLANFGGVPIRYKADVSIKPDMVAIWEVDLATNKCVKFAQMPDSMFQRVMYHRYYNSTGLIRRDPLMQVAHREFLTVAGCDDCVFIMSSYRRPVIYDLGQEAWRTLNLYPNPGGNTTMFKFFIDVGEE